MLNPDVQRHLMRERHETIVDPIIRRHWFAFVRPALEALLGLPLVIVGVFVVDAADPGGVVALVGAAICAHAAWLFLRERRESFVVTNFRVYRLHGVLDTQRASMPLSRILDITVDKPQHGRPPHLRVGRPEPGAEPDPVRRPGRRPREADPARRPRRGPLPGPAVLGTRRLTSA